MPPIDKDVSGQSVVRSKVMHTIETVKPNEAPGSGGRLKK